MPASAACRIKGIEGYTGGPSLIRIEARPGERCTIRHYTYAFRGRSGKVVETRRFVAAERPSSGRVSFSGNRATYRSTTRSQDAFAYRFADRGGYRHDVRVQVVPR